MKSYSPRLEIAAHKASSAANGILSRLGPAVQDLAHVVVASREHLARGDCSGSWTSRACPCPLSHLVDGALELSAEQLTGFRSGGRRVGGRPPTADGPPGSGMSHFHQVGSGHSRRSRRAEAPAPAVQNLAVQGPGVPFPLGMGRHLTITEALSASQRGRHEGIHTALLEIAALSSLAAADGDSDDVAQGQPVHVDVQELADAQVVAKVEWHRGELFPRVGFIVTNMTAGPEGVVRFYNGRGTAEQWIKEGKYALNWTRLSCHRFVANRVRLSLFVLAYNLGNFLRRLCLPKAVKHWSLRSVQVKLIKMGGRLVRHSRWLIFQLSEVSVPRRLFEGVLDRIGRLSPAHGTPAGDLGHGQFGEPGTWRTGGSVVQRTLWEHVLSPFVRVQPVR